MPSRSDSAEIDVAALRGSGDTRHLPVGDEAATSLSLRAALDASQLGFMIVDMQKPKRPILYVNKTVAVRSGYTVDELIGRASVKLTPPEFNLESGPAIRDAMREGRALDAEVRSVRKDGSLYWSGISLAPIRDQRGIVVRYLSVSADITEKHEAELKRKELSVRLEEALRERDRVEVDLRLAQKLEAVGRLAAGVAHEINTPIQYVGDSVRFLQDAFADMKKMIEAFRNEIDQIAAGASVAGVKKRMAAMEMACDVEFLEEEIPKSLQRTVEGIERVTKIVRAMKEFSHPDGTKHEPADVNHAIESTLIVCKNEYKYVSTVEVELGDLPQVVCDVCELNQVFLNLIVNSAHAIESAKKENTMGRIWIKTRLVDDHVELIFGDNGCGISQDYINKIFDPFFTTKGVGKGTGQGLAIVRSIIVDKHKGTVQVDSKLGEGAQFTLRLPVNPPREDDAE
jgi:two-component system, NtrC family, sensor kinase